MRLICLEEKFAFYVRYSGPGPDLRGGRAGDPGCRPPTNRGLPPNPLYFISEKGVWPLNLYSCVQVCWTLWLDLKHVQSLYIYNNLIIIHTINTQFCYLLDLHVKFWSFFNLPTNDPHLRWASGLSPANSGLALDSRKGICLVKTVLVIQTERYYLFSGAILP